jgi:hypothetical protein
VARGVSAQAVAALVTVVLLAGGCGGDGAAGESEEDPLGANQVREAIGADAERVAEETKQVARVFARAVDGRVMFASGNVEGCQGGSFDGPTAFGYQANGRVDHRPGATPEQLATQVEQALEDAGWTEVTIDQETPSQVGVSADRGGPVAAIRFVEGAEGTALFTVRGRCLPVTDEGREAAYDLIEPREIIPNRLPDQ